MVDERDCAAMAGIAMVVLVTTRDWSVPVASVGVEGLLFPQTPRNRGYVWAGEVTGAQEAIVRSSHACRHETYHGPDRQERRRDA